MIGLICVLINLAPLVSCQLSTCRFGGEQCICIQRITIQCFTPRSESMSDLPIEFSQLSLDVTYIIFYQNKKISQIINSSSLSRLKLDTLNLQYNQIEIIEPAAFEYTSVKKMYLEWNSLVKLDFLIDSLCQLQELYLGHNKIKHLKKEWFQCKKKLVKLSLVENYLKSIESSVFCQMPNLVKLSIYGHLELEIIEQGAFCNGSILELNLSEMNLTNWDFLTGSLCQLQKLDLSLSKIEHLKKEWFECKNNLLTLSVSYNKLVSIESGVFCNVPNLVSLNLDGNYQLETIESGAFCNSSIVELDLTEKKITNLEFLTGSLCQLQKINLKNSKIEYLKREWFECKTNLINLYISYTRMTFIDSLVFSDMISLSTIELKYNQIHTIEPFTFSNLINLVTLDIGSNMIKEIKPYAFSNLINLATLDIGSNVIKEIKPYAFNNLTSLESITSLANQFIQSIYPYSFVGLIRLFKLSFEGNLLTRLSDKTFVGLDSLIELNLKDNYLIKIESGVFDDVPNLRYLNLSLNQLIKIDKGHFSSLKRLDTLTLDQNRIEVIEPFSFDHQGESLQSLNLSYNKLGLVKTSHFANLRVLSTLDLSHNQISSIEPASFENSSSLVELRLDHNCIFAIHKDLFKNLDQLQTLSMSNNVLIQLDPMVFRHNLSQLSTLILSFNQIDSLPDLLFNNLKRLTVLDLSNNRLKYLNRTQIFQGLGSLKYFDLSYNFIKTVSIQPVQGTLVSLRLGFNRLDVIELSNEVKLIAFRIIDLSSNLNLNNASQLMSSLEKCQSCKYEFKFRNMSTQFIKDFVQHLTKSTSLVSKITSLDLSYNDLSRVIDLIPFSSMNSSLTGLYLKNTKINSSVSFLQKLVVLAALDLSESQIVLSRVYFSNRPFTYLYLSNTGLKDIRNESPKIYYSVELDLSRNMIEIVNRDDFGTHLQILNLSYNRIFRIKSDFESKSTMMLFYGVCMDLSHNLLTSITIYYDIRSDILLDNNRIKNLTFFGGFLYSTLNILKLDDNPLDDYDLNLAWHLLINRNNLTSIKRKYSDKTVCYSRELIVTSNQIVEIEDNSFFYCKDLNHLDLSNNLLSNMTNQTFAGLLSLEYLNLSSNLIEFIRHGVFDESKLLKTLDLNNNKIKNIMDKSFDSLIYLEKLYLDSLQMGTISNQTFEGLESVKFMKLNSIQFDSVHNLDIIKRLSKEIKSKNTR